MGRSICVRGMISVLCAAVACGAFLFAAGQNGGPAHGMWVWKGPSVAADASGAEQLRDFCRAQGVNEIYISIAHDKSADEQFARLIELMHKANIRVEALLSSTDADEAGTPREKLLGHVREVIEFNVEFNRDHPKRRFDGIHLDIEPQQREENKGAGNLRFLPGLAGAYRDVRALAEPEGLTVNADIQNKLLKGSADERRTLLTALPRVTLMMYEVSNPTDSTEDKVAKVRSESRKYLEMAYDGLHDENLARMAIGLRTPDYGTWTPTMLKEADAANRENAHYLGWAWHDYADAQQAVH